MATIDELGAKVAALKPKVDELSAAAVRERLSKESQDKINAAYTEVVSITAVVQAAIDAANIPPAPAPQAAA
jgi:hypothetical protein